MAVSAATLWSAAVILCLFFIFTAVTTNENTTGDIYNTTAFGEQNFTVTVTDTYTATTEPALFESSSPTPSSSSVEEESSLPGEPLPASGRLLTPVTAVGRLCPCDVHSSVCDISCCCDRDCGEEVALFTSCSVSAVSGSRQLCSRDVASYSLSSKDDGRSQLRSSVQKETSYGVFCIQSQNRVDGLSHPSPALPTNRNFESLFNPFTSFVLDSAVSDQVSAAELQAQTGYQYGDVMVTAEEDGHRGTFFLPAAAVTADCVDRSPAGFLKDQSSRCSRRVILEQDCSSLPTLSMNTYTDVQLFAEKNTDAAVVPVEVSSVILQATDGSQTEVEMSGAENLCPVLLSPQLCANVVLKVSYVIQYSSAGEIVNASVSVVLGFVHADRTFLEQEFQLKFVQKDSGELAVHHSGNPGYVVGLPLVSGTRMADGMIRSIDLRDGLSLLMSTEDQDCLRGPHQRSSVLFGVDSISGCTLRLDDITNCSLVSQLLLEVLRGPNYPQHVASFGNSPLENPQDWVQIKSTFIPGESQSCSVPLSLHLEVEWTQYGALVNPQAQIVSIREVIQTNSSSLSQLSGGSGVMPIRNSVAFIPVSAAAVPGFRAMPTINARLPFDFFFPFV
ncbi:tectonic-1 [Pholidichthys leucotaenia]